MLPWELLSQRQLGAGQLPQRPSSSPADRGKWVGSAWQCSSLNSDQEEDCTRAHIIVEKNNLQNPALDFADLKCDQVRFSCIFGVAGKWQARLLLPFPLRADQMP